MRRFLISFFLRGSFGLSRRRCRNATLRQNSTYRLVDDVHYSQSVANNKQPSTIHHDSRHPHSPALSVEFAPSSYPLLSAESVEPATLSRLVRLRQARHQVDAKQRRRRGTKKREDEERCFDETSASVMGSVLREYGRRNDVGRSPAGGGKACFKGRLQRKEEKKENDDDDDLSGCRLGASSLVAGEVRGSSTVLLPRLGEKVGSALRPLCSLSPSSSLLQHTNTVNRLTLTSIALYTVTSTPSTISYHPSVVEERGIELVSGQGREGEMQHSQEQPQPSQRQSTLLSIPSTRLGTTEKEGGNSATLERTGRDDRLTHFTGEGE